MSRLLRGDVMDNCCVKKQHRPGVATPRCHHGFQAHADVWTDVVCRPVRVIAERLVEQADRVTHPT